MKNDNLMKILTNENEENFIKMKIKHKKKTYKV